jgi:mitotic spindle assembly checkpoint protein MAD2
MPPVTQSGQIITLKGSTDIVTEFFQYSVNSILYQRGVYAPETFKRVAQYGLSMMMTTDEGLVAYLQSILRQLEGELELPDVPHHVLLIGCVCNFGH